VRAKYELEARVLDRTLELKVKQNELKSEKSLLDAVLSSIEQGLLAYDKNLNLIIANRRFKEIRDVPDELAQYGTPFEKLIRFDVARSEFGEGDPRGLVLTGQ
jgi:signal transduction histidine kinase